MNAEDSVSRVDPDQPGLAERQADRDARRQQREAFDRGWTGDNWVACGCAVVGNCPNATCVNHRLHGASFAP